MHPVAVGNAHGAGPAGIFRELSSTIIQVDRGDLNK